MLAWMMKNMNTGCLIPSSGGWSRRDTVSSFVKNCDWYDNPTWGILRKDGFKPVKVEIQEWG